MEEITCHVTRHGKTTELLVQQVSNNCVVDVGSAALARRLACDVVAVPAPCFCLSENISFIQPLTLPPPLFFFPWLLANNFPFISVARALPRSLSALHTHFHLVALRLSAS